MSEHGSTPVPPDLQGLRALIRPDEDLLIVPHVNPDGDAIGSALAFAELVEQLGGRPQVCCHHEVPSYLRFLPGVERVSRTVSGKPETVAILDLNVLDRVGETMLPSVQATSTRLLIDHHQGGDIQADWSYIDTSAPATAMLIYRLFAGFGLKPSRAAAQGMATGIVTDTGSFRFPNTTPESMHATAQLMEYGADLVTLSEEVYSNRPRKALDLLQRMLNNIHVSPDGRFAWSWVSSRDFGETDTLDPITEGFSNYLMGIEGVKSAALLRQEPGKKVRVSLRSRGDVDVTKVAAEFGGGGHKNASGCTFSTSLEEATEQVVEAMQRWLASS